jgi:hypothetical protein
MALDTSMDSSDGTRHVDGFAFAALEGGSARGHARES